MSLHTSVMSEEVLALLSVRSQCHYIDCTFGAGGHTESILRAMGSRGSMLALELDEDALRIGKERLLRYKKQLPLYRGNFRDLKSIVEELDFGPVCGILFDFGLSMDLIKVSGRGFSFLQNEPLDMRFDTSQPFTAEDLIATWPESQIADVLYHFGDETFARVIAKRIVAARKQEPISTTSQLVDIVASSVTPQYRRRKSHFATKTFQAIRMAVNDEIGAIETSLRDALQLLAPGGRIVTITFHSLEDRVVKRIFREAAQQKKINLLTKKPLEPSDEEIKKNPAARSAKIRAIEKREE